MNGVILHLIMHVFSYGLGMCMTDLGSFGIDQF